MQVDNKATKPLVSVIMPAYNAELFIEEAINSVISQTISDWEMFVLDDCSSDDTFSLAQLSGKGEPRIHIIRNDKNLGVAKTRNRGINLAQGQYIAFLDSDDIWHPNKLECQLRKMREAGASVGYCSYEIIGADGLRVRPNYLVPEIARFKDLLKENYIQCSAMLIRADVLKRIMFNTDFFHEDYILGLDMLRSGEMAVGCRDVLLSWRYIENSRSFNKKKAAVNRWKIYRNYLRLPLYKAIYYFGCYSVAGFRKYFK